MTKVRPFCPVSMLCLLRLLCLHPLCSFPQRPHLPWRYTWDFHGTDYAIDILARIIGKLYLKYSLCSALPEMNISRLPWPLSNWCIFVGFFFLLKCYIPKFKHKDTFWRLKSALGLAIKKRDLKLFIGLLSAAGSNYPKWMVCLYHWPPPGIPSSSSFLGLCSPSPASLQDQRFILVQQLCHEPQPRHWLALPSGPAGSLEKQPSFVMISFSPLLSFPNLSGIELIKSRARNRPDLLFHRS